jgi:hypothetical protein
MADRREMLEAALSEALEPQDEGKPVDTEPQEEVHAESEVEVSKDEPVRDEKGRFVAKDETPTEEASPENIADDEVEAEQPEEQPTVDDIPKPTTWKKDLLPLWDKIAKGETLTPEESRKHLEYLNQRENEFKKGVSVYKAEAERAKALEEAINPFIPELQSQGISPAAWINNLGRAHMVLTRAPYEQKVQMFHRLAQDYGVNLNAVAQPTGEQAPQDAYTQQLMQQLYQVNQEVSTIKSRFEQEEQQRLASEIERVRSNKERFPHFDMVREEMAQLLELGKAPDLETAYAKAVRLNDEVWALEQEKLLNDAKKQASRSQQVARAKATAVSPKSVTPNGVQAKVDAKDRRSMLMAQLAEAENGRL